MTYKQKMDKECPTVDKDFIIFSCPGHYFDNAPRVEPGDTKCGHIKCVDCWNSEIPSLESPEKTAVIDVQKIAARVKEVYDAFRDEDLNHQEALEFTKIIIAEEVRHGLSML